MICDDGKGGDEGSMHWRWPILLLLAASKWSPPPPYPCYVFGIHYCTLWRPDGAPARHLTTSARLSTLGGQCNGLHILIDGDRVAQSDQHDVIIVCGGLVVRVWEFCC